MRKLFSFFLAVLLPLAACSGEDSPVGPNREGSLSFAYSGAVSGTFAVSGEANLDATNYPQNAFAAAVTESGGVFIAGFRPTERPKLDYIGISLTGVTGPGTITVCTGPSGSGCPSLFFFLGLAGRDFDQAYAFTSGNVTISGFTTERVRGTFQGTAVFIAATGEPDFTRTVAVTNGQFDVPIRNDL